MLRLETFLGKLALNSAEIGSNNRATVSEDDASRQQTLLRMAIRSHLRRLRLIRKRQQELRETTLRRRIIPQDRGESGVAEGFRETLSQGFAGSCVIR